MKEYDKSVHCFVFHLVDIKIRISNNDINNKNYSVPTFASDDREWDSYGIHYIIQHNGQLCAIRKRGGYRLAKVSYFDNVYCADTITVQFMETIGMIGRQFVM